MTCGSFWKCAATTFSGIPSRTAENACSRLPPMEKSILPASIIARLFTCGPPGTMVTLSPQAS